MTEKDIIVAGEEAKYFIDIQQEGFSMADDDFTVELLWGMQGQTMTLMKHDMNADTSGKYFFSFPTKGMVGTVTARCVWQVPDTDESDSERTKVDEQILCFVVQTPCPKLVQCQKCVTTGFVTYERTEDSSIASMYQRLCTAAGQPIVSDDDLYFYVLTSAEENDN